MPLFVVATPIGHLGDISARALETLRQADQIACEDTRRTGILLRHFGIQARLVSYHDRNERTRTTALIHALQRGERVALVSNAGMPLVSDPGYVLVTSAIENGIPVTVIPGSSAVLSALVASGLPCHRFIFDGFLPKKAGARHRLIKSYAQERRTVVLFESPHRVQRLLEELADFLGDRRMALVREQTKIHEEVIRGTAAMIRDRLDHPRGEYTVVIEGARE